jgi:hypothetical protein
MSYVKACVLGAVGALGLAVATPASAMTLAELKSNGTPIVVGDKVYSNFDFISPVLSGSDIGVNFVQGTAGQPDAIQFGAGWNTAYPPNGNLDTVIMYTVTASNGGSISSVGLDMAGLISVGGGTASVGETLTDAATGQQYQLQVLYDGAGGQPDTTSASLTLGTPAAALNVRKDINVTVNGGSGFAAVTFVDNTYTSGPGIGTPPPIPEPMSLALLPLALAGLGLRKKLAR